MWWNRERWLEGKFANVDGIAFQMPVGTKSSPALYAGFSIDAAAAEAMLPGCELHAVRLWSRGVMIVAVVDYQDTTIGTYVEFCIGILCFRHSSVSEMGLEGFFKMLKVVNSFA